MEEKTDTHTPGSKKPSKAPPEVQEFVKNSDSFKENYDIVQELGGGNYGGVFSARCKGKDESFPECVALKIMEESSFEDKEINSNLKLLIGGQCENLVRFIHLHNITYNSKRFFIVVMELCTGGTLEKSKFQDRYKEYEFQLHMFRGLIKGLIFIHSFDLVHHDIHKGNILFKSESDPTVKYGDFGLTKEEASHTRWDDIKRLTDTLIRVVFKIKSSGSLTVRDIASKLRDKKVSKSIIEVIVGLRERSMNLEDASEKIEDMIRKQPKEGDDRITASAPEGSCFPCTSGELRRIETESTIREKRTDEEVLNIDPFYPKKSNGDLLQPEDLVHFIIVYARPDYEYVTVFREWFNTKIEKGIDNNFQISMYDDETFSADKGILAKEIYDRAMFVMFYLTNNFHKDKLSTFMNSEGIGHTKFEHNTHILKTHHYSYVAQKHKDDCRRPIHTMCENARNYSTPTGLTNIKGIDYFDTEDNKKYLEYALGGLAQRAKKKFVERERAMWKCLYHETDGVHNAMTDVSVSNAITNSMSDLQIA